MCEAKYGPEQADVKDNVGLSRKKKSGQVVRLWRLYAPSSK